MIKIKVLFRSLGSTPTGTYHPDILLGRLAVLFYLAAQPFTHNAALKNVGILGMLVALIWLLFAKRLAVDWHSPILRGVGGLLLALAATAAIGIEPADSFGELRKHFLPGVLLLLLIPRLFSETPRLRLLLGVLALAFMLRSGLTLVELGHYFPDLEIGRAEGNFIKGYSLDAGFYIPVLMTLFMLGGRWRWLAPLGLLAAFVAMLLVQSRTPLVAMALAIFLMLLALRQWRTLIVCITVAAVLTGTVMVRQATLAERLASTFSQETYDSALETRNYSKANGLAARVPIWAGVLEITASRYWQGYGFGWKKLGRIAVDQGYVARWQGMTNDPFSTEQADYFSQNPSTVNPHNLYLQVYFESGLFGLATYLVMLATLFWQAARQAWRGRETNQILGALALAYLVNHVILGLSNGLLIGLGPSLALIALLEVARRSEKTT